MLDYGAVARQLVGWADYQQAQRDRLRAALAGARRRLAEADQAAWADKVATSHTSWLPAIPLEPPAARFPQVSPPDYTVLATDGSQIAPSRQEVAPCFLLNVGWVSLSYGDRAAATLGNEPVISYRAEEMVTDYGSYQAPMDEKALADRRRLLEADRLRTLVGEAEPPAVAMVDGSLVWWQLQGDSEPYRREMLGLYLPLFEQARGVGIPVAGYISDPAAREVATGLRLLACPERAPDCDRCPFEGELPCRQDDLGLVADGGLFAGSLQPGERSAVFESSSRILSAYGRHHVAFFYLHTGGEIARVEVPGWCARDRGLLELVHAVAYDQAQKGGGYPVSLAEAHQQAVVTAADRAAFYRLLTGGLVRIGLPASQSAKQVAKRAGRV